MARSSKFGAWDLVERFLPVRMRTKRQTALVVNNAVRARSSGTVQWARNILRVSPGVSTKNIQRAFRTRALQTHPNKSPTASPAIKERRLRAFKDVYTAREILLTDLRSRQEELVRRLRRPTTYDNITEDIRKHPDIVDPAHLEQYIRAHPRIVHAILETGRIPPGKFEAAVEHLKDSDVLRVMRGVPGSTVQAMRQYHTQQINATKKKKCSELRATLFNSDLPRSLERRINLPGMIRIPRSKALNNVEGPRFYEAVTMQIIKRDVPPLVRWKLMTHPIYRCKYVDIISRFDSDIIIIEDTSGHIVAAAAFDIDEAVLTVGFLCSGKQCAGAGTACLRALEVYGKMRLCTYIDVSSAPGAVPFYIRVGFSSQLNTKTVEPTVTMKPNGTKAINYTGVHHYMRKTL